MAIEHNGIAGPCFEYDGLPALHAVDKDLPLLHPYAPVTPGRYVTPGGGRLTIRPAEMRAHIRITLDHLGCPAQLTDEKNAAFKRLALAAEGYCVQSGCRHSAAYADGVYRIFEVRHGSITLAAFVRAALAVELGDFAPADRLVQEAEALAGPVRREGWENQASGG
ncbi:hypothetical protein B046DRAFT_06122 [Streptomyces sp. LamerLS-316]|uniref:DUF6420 family protein n=1 Tax=unclassified Streptomyces TaxID=2593676 RepID=UPI000823CDA9|nr:MULTISPECIES: DUF6420 family protein [unclassified Streptomyces]MYQ39872.1 hypothetical protein [Streptomyces sp. SID4921]MYQ40693.1 hypothetical protein [Streptomyces sp. SID4921]SCK04851.1 hypothetical protein B046DRAFT_00017 [Streptomyces sp. LamerLS-316]SCK19034.1 hypothetical protein B046DRAFT_06122 [Streptomyces sp. LamerLS-316]